MKRAVLKCKANGGGNYFTSPKPLAFIPTGAKVLDLALGGGWAKNRIANVVGDKSTGKTLLMIEACANFAHVYPKGRIFYRESEAAFDERYAEVLGMPIDRVEFGDHQLDTVEDLFNDIQRCMKLKGDSLYILDSLDALTDRAEMERGIEQGTYGSGKAKKMSELFRRVVRELKRSDMTILLVSQIRDRIGVTFGRKTTRSGGRALDFYASQVLYLSQLGRIVKSVGKIKRPTGVRVLAFCDKNKVSTPFRQAEFVIKFGYGVDDEQACEQFLKDVGKKRANGSLDKLREQVETEWYALEEQFLPKERKYGSSKQVVVGVNHATARKQRPADQENA
jgi:recombination protein RecA